MGACRTATGCCNDSPVTWILAWSGVLSQFRESKGKLQGEQSSARGTDGPPAEASTVSSETSKASQDQPTNECPSANDSSMTLALSPESDWDSYTCAGSTSSASQALASFLENMTTPRGKSRGHKSLSPDSLLSKNVPRQDMSRTHD